MQVAYEEITSSFPLICKDCYLSFHELNKIKKRIDEKKFNSHDLAILLGIFQKRRTNESRFKGESSRVAMEFWAKEELFFSAHLIRRGSMMSKPTIDFFEYASNNEEDYGMLYSLIAAFKQEMEKAWYGILQKYGKAVLELAKIKS